MIIKDGSVKLLVNEKNKNTRLLLIIKKMALYIDKNPGKCVFCSHNNDDDVTCHHRCPDYNEIIKIFTEMVAGEMKDD